MRYTILDASCSIKGMWTQKNHRGTIYIDKRRTVKGFMKTRPKYTITPTIKMDNRAMAFKDKTFKIVVIDPPHTWEGGPNSWLIQKYGKLNKKTWRKDIKKAFTECWRVLDTTGIMIMKWNNYNIKTRDIVRVIGKTPSIRNAVRTRNGTTTMWLIFIKGEECHYLNK